MTEASDGEPSKDAEITESGPADKMETDGETKTDDKTETSATESAPKAKRRKEEATSQKLPNLSRVVPAQLLHITFPSEGRFSPVRPLISSGTVSAAPVSNNAAPSTAASILAEHATTSRMIGGGILILRDGQPDADGEYLEFEANKSLAATEAAPATAQAAAPTSTDPAVDLSEPIAEVPPPFEYHDWD